MSGLCSGLCVNELNDSILFFKRKKYAIYKNLDGGRGGESNQRLNEKRKKTQKKSPEEKSNNL